MYEKKMTNFPNKQPLKTRKMNKGRRQGNNKRKLSTQ